MNLVMVRPQVGRCDTGQRALAVRAANEDEGATGTSTSTSEAASWYARSCRGTRAERTTAAFDEAAWTATRTRVAEVAPPLRGAFQTSQVDVDVARCPPLRKATL